MSKRLKTLTASLLLASIMIVTLAGAAFAERDYNGNCYAPSEDCPIRAQDGSCQD